MKQILCGLVVLLLCCESGAQGWGRFVGTNNFVGSGVNGLPELSYNYSPDWYFDVSIGDGTLTISELRLSYLGTIQHQFPNEVRELDLDMSMVFDPVTVPLFPTIDGGTFISGFFDVPDSVSLSGAYRSLEFSGAFDGEMPVVERYVNNQDAIPQMRILLSRGPSSIIVGGTSSIAFYYGSFSDGMELTPTFPTQSSASITYLGFNGQFALDALPIFHSLAGDMNDDGIVDAADYILTRNDPKLFSYSEWREHYGNVPSSASSAATPEPSTLVFLFPALLFAYAFNSRCGLN